MSTSTTTTDSLVTSGETDTQVTSDKEILAENIIRKNLLWGAGAGILPIPVFDVVAITGVQIKLVKELADLYGVPFKEDIVKNLTGALLAGLGAPTVAAAVTISAFKFVPVLGPFVGLLSSPSFAVAFTYAVGKVFTQHFASGGTFLDFEPKKVREYFARQFAEGKSVAPKAESHKPASKAS
jgi:uncharacterized protein (DUF697 family)